jgi:tetratricopeptide (TPR) repeat protein
MRLLGTYFYDLPSLSLMPDQVLVRQPNKKAAISLSNLSVAYMNLEQYDKALHAAEIATKLCPSYWKAHHRLEVCYHKLNRTKESKEKQEEINIFKQDLFPSYNLNLYALPWISARESLFISMRDFA